MVLNSHRTVRLIRDGNRSLLYSPFYPEAGSTEDGSK